MMKKCYALLMAVVMAVSAGSMVSAKTTPEVTIDSGEFTKGESVSEFYVTSVELEVDGRTYTQSVSKTVDVVSGTATARAAATPARKGVLAAIDGTTFRNVQVNKKLYTAKLTRSGDNLRLTLSPSVGAGDNIPFSVSVHGSGKELSTNNVISSLTFGFGSSTINTGANEILSDTTIENLSGVKLQDVIYCDAAGYPVPFTENSSNAEDGDRNGSDGVRSGSTVYFMIQEGKYKFDDDLYWKLRVSKGTNGKYIKKISDVSKSFSKDLYNATDNADRVEETSGRHRYIKVELNDIYTDDEYKIRLDLRLTPRQKAIDVFNVDDGAQIKVNDFYFYMKNAERDADNEWKVGTKGLMLNPLENDWNEVTYYDEESEVAFMKFFADSDVDKFFAKLSTKWEHADYASYFNDQDAYVFDFTGSPKISSTSRCDLQIYNPFLNDDGDETIDPTTAVIYQVIDGDLFDVTDSFIYQEGDNGEMAYTCRTRFLGTYIICEKPVDEAL